MIKMQGKMKVRDDQNIMIDDALLDAIAGLATLNKKDSVLEIGGGPGNLAKRLAKQCGKLTIVEKDERYAKLLEDKFNGVGAVTVIHGDILKVGLPRFNKIVSNTPYSILQQFFVRLVKERRYNFECAVLVVPHGFTAKITAQPSSRNFGALSALFSGFYRVEVLMEIGKGSFSPPPRVKSECVRITLADGAPKDITGYLFRKLFLNEDKKVKNLLTELFWNDGKLLFDRRFTKTESQELAHKALGARFASIGDKKAAELSNAEFRCLANSVRQPQPT